MRSEVVITNPPGNLPSELLRDSIRGLSVPITHIRHNTNIVVLVDDIIARLGNNRVALDEWRSYRNANRTIGVPLVGNQIIRP